MGSNQWTDRQVYEKRPASAKIQGFRFSESVMSQNDVQLPIHQPVLRVLLALTCLVGAKVAIVTHKVQTTRFPVRGVAQVLALPLSRGMDAAISGVAGLGHICLGAGLVVFFLALKKAACPANVQ